MTKEQKAKNYAKKFSSNFDQKEATEDFLAGYKAGYTARDEQVKKMQELLTECMWRLGSLEDYGDLHSEIVQYLDNIPKQ